MALRPQRYTVAVALLALFAGLLLGGAAMFGDRAAADDAPSPSTALYDIPERGLLPAQGEVSGAAVHGSDDRLPIDGAEAPWRSVAYLEMQYYGVPIGSCTATVIGDGVLLTAAHCVAAGPGDLEATAVRVVPAKNGAVEPFGSQYAESAAWPNSFSAGLEGSVLNSPWDYALVFMPDAALTNLVGSFPGQLGGLTDQELNSHTENWWVVGYPGDCLSATCWHDAAGSGPPYGTYMWAASASQLDLVFPQYFFDSIDIWQGNSGGIIFRERDGAIAGVVSQSGPDWNRSTRLHATAVNELRTWCEGEPGCGLATATAATPTSSPTRIPTTVPTPGAPPTGTAIHRVVIPGVSSGNSGGSPAPTATPTRTLTPSSSATGTPTPTKTTTPTFTATATATSNTSAPTTTPTPTRTATKSPTPTPTPDTGKISDMLWDWYDDVGFILDDYSAITQSFLSGALSPSTAAGMMLGIQSDADSLSIWLGQQSLTGAPQVCKDARDSIALSADWLWIMAGWYYLIYVQWPYADYFDELQEASGYFFDTRYLSIDLINGCDLAT